MRKFICTGIILAILLTGCQNVPAVKTNQNTPHSSRIKKLDSKQLKQLKEHIYHLNLTIAFYDAHINNIRDNIQSSMDTDSISTIQKISQKVLTKPLNEIESTDKADFKGIKKLELPSKTVKEYQDNFQKARQYQNNWTIALKEFNINNIDETIHVLNKHQDDYHKATVKLAHSEVNLFKDAGLTDKQASKQVSSSMRKAINEVGTPEKAAEEANK